MRIIGLTLVFLSMIAVAKEVPQHYTVDNLPLGWNTSNDSIVKGEIKDANATRIIFQYREFSNSTSENQIFKAIQKNLVSKYTKLVDLGPTSVASHATEGYQAVDLGGMEHRFYIVVDASKTPGKGWLIEVMGRKPQISTVEAEISLILTKIKLI